MKGDFSRTTFRPERHYRTVLQQQGRVTVDADPNEESEILNQRQDSTTADVIGSAGRPKGEFVVAPAGADVTIGKGTLYLDGIPCVNDADCSIKAQPFLPLVPAGLADLQGAGTYALYLRVFERLITAVEDPTIREKALGGADTCSRSQLVWQVRLEKINPPGAGVSCANIGNTWKPVLSPGQMTAQTVALPAGSSPCVLPPQADYRSLENQLYRVEIHKGGPFAAGTFKWSRENASVLTAVLKRNAGDTQDAGPVLSVATTGRDADIGFGNEQFVELLDDRIELTPSFQPLSLTKDVRAALNEIELHAAATLPAQFAYSPKLRRWDQTTGDQNGIPLNSAPVITLENGVAVSFDAAGDYKPGDYWLIPARTAIDRETGFIEWPTDNPALDALCNNMSGACTIVVRPGLGWEAPILALPANSDAEICFPVGSFPVPPGGVNIPDLGNLKLTGTGVGTLISNPTGESCITFLRCASVIVRDLAATTSFAGPPPARHLTGALMFSGCGMVELDSVRLESGDNAQRNAACLNVSFTVGKFSRAGLRVHGCTLIAGQQQYGILMTGFVAGVRVHIEDNEILCTRPEPTILVRNIVKDPLAVANLTAMIATNARVLKLGAPVSKHEPSVQVGNYLVAFRSDPRVRAGFLQAVEKNIDIVGAASPSVVAGQIGALAKTFASDTARWKEVAGLGVLGFTFQKRAIVGLRGICLSGTQLQEASILNNTIVRFHEGVHVGLSHRELQRGIPDIAESVLIQNNRIETELTPGDTAQQTPRLRGPFAIYVGNVTNLLILENHAIVDGAGGDNRAQAGIVAFGYLGPRILIRGNHLDGFRVGAHLERAADATLPVARLWMATENVFSKASSMVDGELSPPLAASVNVTIP